MREINNITIYEYEKFLIHLSADELRKEYDSRRSDPSPKKSYYITKKWLCEQEIGKRRMRKRL
mgnify:CR=1 FL=1